VALGQRAVAGEQLLELLMRLREDRLVGVGRPHAVAPLDLVRVRDGLAGEHAGVCAEPGDLVAQPAVLELVEQRVGVGDKRRRVDRRLGAGGGGKLGRPVVGVDDPVDMPADPQPQAEVALDSWLHPASLRAAAGPHGAPL
jgi:hypothetical protein